VQRPVVLRVAALGMALVVVLPATVAGADPELTVGTTTRAELPSARSGLSALTRYSATTLAFDEV
jgi:hypothetical protein